MQTLLACLGRWAREPPNERNTQRMLMMLMMLAMILACLGRWAREPPNERNTQRMLMMLMMLAMILACLGRWAREPPNERNTQRMLMMLAMMLACLGRWARGPPEREEHPTDAHDAHDACDDARMSRAMSQRASLLILRSYGVWVPRSHVSSCYLCTGFSSLVLSFPMPLGPKHVR